MTSVTDPEAVALVMRLFDLSEEEFYAGINENNKWVDKRIEHFMNSDVPDNYGYLLGLADTDKYGMFGADKAGMKDEYTLEDFFDAINVDIDDLKIEMIKFDKCDRFSCNMRPYTLFSRDKKISLTLSSSKAIEKGYFHYFGLTGEISAVLVAFKAFDKYCTNEGMCWNGRDFI